MWLRNLASAHTILSFFYSVSYQTGPYPIPVNMHKAGKPRRAWILPDCLWKLLGTSGCRCRLAAHSGRSPFHPGHSHASSTGSTRAGISWSCDWRWWVVGAEPASRGKSWWAGTSEISILGWISTWPQKMYCWNRPESHMTNKYCFSKYQLPPPAAHSSTHMPEGVTTHLKTAIRRLTRRMFATKR